MADLADSCKSMLRPFVGNLTSSYADQKNESTMVVTSVAMFLLAALFFNVNLFSRFSNVSAILNPTVRLCLSTALSLFLPVMSYLFSEAKHTADNFQSSAAADSTAAITGRGSSIQQLQSAGAGTGADELSLRARTILMWMLLVELLRKKVEAILVNSGMQWYSGTIDRASRIVWLGYLVFNNVKSVGKKAIYGTLWVLAAGKLLQRVAIKEIFKRSFAYDKNAQLLDSYMAQLMQPPLLLPPPPPPAELEGSELLKKCKYAVMGEDRIKRKAGPDGYHFELPKKTTSTAVVTDGDDGDGDSTTATPTITVGDIWTMVDAEKDDGLLKDEYPRLKRLCLSFALYKLLRRRFEDLPITAAETRDCRDLIFRGLHRELLQQHHHQQDKDEAAAITMFQVFDEEIQFLCEYYHSVLPVVLSSPFFFLANYILFPIVVWSFCILTFILCGNGNVVYAFKSIHGDNYIISKGAVAMTVCLMKRIRDLPEVLFSTIDLGITILLLLTFIYEEVWEFLVFILSNWLMVSLLCEHAAKREWRSSRPISRLVRCILWVRSKISGHNLCFKQFSVMWFPWPMSAVLPTTVVPRGVKKSIMEYLATHVVNGGGGALSRDGWSVLQSNSHSRYHDMLSSACGDRSCAEVILICHIATSLMEVKHSMDMEKKKKEETREPAESTADHSQHHRKVATALSRYCAYLVALYPELLPEDKDGTARVYKEMKEELKKELGGCVKYHLSRQSTRYEKLMEISGRETTVTGGGGQQQLHEGEALSSSLTTKTVVLQKGAELGRKLTEEKDEAGVWELLADLWTELMVYVAPSSGELHVKAHREVLAKGGEFITLLWAMATHTGMTRPAVKPWSVVRVADIELATPSSSSYRIESK